MHAPTPYVLVLCSCPDDVAAVIARSLVEKRVAACVNILPRGQSIYRWQGEVTQDSETLLMIKTSRACLERLEQEVRETHPYEVPELLAMDIAAGGADYLDWLADNVS